MSSQEYIRSVTEIVPDDFPTLTPLPEGGPSSSSGSSFLTNITWQRNRQFYLLMQVMVD